MISDYVWRLKYNFQDQSTLKDRCPASNQNPEPHLPGAYVSALVLPIEALTRSLKIGLRLGLGGPIVEKLCWSCGWGVWWSQIVVGVGVVRHKLIVLLLWLSKPHFAHPCFTYYCVKMNGHWNNFATSNLCPNCEYPLYHSDSQPFTIYCRNCKLPSSVHTVYSI